MFKPTQMNTYLLVTLGLLLSCSSVKEASLVAVDTQLLTDVEILSSAPYEGRKTGTKGADMARVYLNKRFIETGLKPLPGLRGYEQDFTFGEAADAQVKGKNMLGLIPGKTDSVIVISAHYDHLGMGKNGIYHGADDNASGVAALLKIAGYFKKDKPKHTLIFAAFDAEELGLQGAKAFVKNPPVALSKIKLNINMDMISHNDKNELYVCGTAKYPALRNYFYTTSANPKILFGHDDPKSGHNDWTNQSDHSAFNDKNIPFIYFGVEDHKDYHKITDEYKNINKNFFTDAANAILEIIINIDKEQDAQQLFHEKLKMKRQ